MPNMIKKVALRVQSLHNLCFGPDSALSDYDNIIKYVAIRNDDINVRFQSLGLQFDTQVVVLLQVPANTTDLSTYQADGGLLADLFMPDSTSGDSPLEWRLTGQSDLAWEPVPWVGKIIDTNSATQTPGGGFGGGGFGGGGFGGGGGAPLVQSISSIVESFEWRSGIIYISPCNEIVDLRIRGDFVPNFADNDAAPIIKGMTSLIAYWTSDLMGGIGPGAEAGTVAAKFHEEAKQAEWDFICLLNKAQMSDVNRLGGRRTQWPGPVGTFTVPIVG